MLEIISGNLWKEKTSEKIIADQAIAAVIELSIWN